LCIILGGGWVGETVNQSVKVRSAIWVVLLLAIAVMAIRGLRDPAAREAQTL